MQKGMTLIELLVAIVVTAVLVSIALPSYQLMKVNQEIESNTKLIYAYMQRVKSLAEYSNRVIEIHVVATDDKSEYCFVSVYKSTSNTTVKCDNSSGLPILKYKLSKNIDVSVNGGLFPSAANMKFTFNGVRGLADSSNVVIDAPTISGATARKIIISSVARLSECSFTPSESGGGKVCI